MNLTLGLALILVAGLLQGTFVLPMTLTRVWKWEHTWAAFSLMGMLVFNWAIGLSVLPHLAQAIRITPMHDLCALIFFGGCWGAGAILFGLGMEKLGMAVGYPIIMGLILSLGALVPLVQSGLGQMVTRPGLLLIGGTLVVLCGIVLCSQAAARKGDSLAKRTSSATGTGLAIAIFAGVLSCLPNVGLNNAASLTAAAIHFGAAPAMAGNAVWVVQFTAGFAVNFLYCMFLIVRGRSASIYRGQFLRNAGLVFGMALIWIGSFYLYGLGAARIGRWGAILGWPMFIASAILVGNLWGLWRGEWATAVLPARRRLSLGLIVILFAEVLFGLGGALR